jgi:hypothetical protein
MWGERPPDAKSGCERLRERPEVDHAVLIERTQCIRRRFIEMQQPVRVVLEHEDLVRATDLEDFGSAVSREGDSCRIVEVRNGVEELDAATLTTEMRNRLPQRLGNQAILVHCHVHDAGLVRAEHTERTDITRRLGEDHIARIDEELRDEVERLLRPGRRHDVVDRTANALK